MNKEEIKPKASKLEESKLAEMIRTRLQAEVERKVAEEEKA